MLFHQEPVLITENQIRACFVHETLGCNEKSKRKNR